MGIRVVIADGDPIFRKGLRAVLDADPSFTVVAEDTHASAALISIYDHLPDVAVIELDMLLPDGTSIPRVIHTERLPVSVVIFSYCRDRDMVCAALDAGVRGLVDKEKPTLEIVDCVKAVAAGGLHLNAPLLIRSQGGPIALAGGTPEELTSETR